MDSKQRIHASESKLLRNTISKKCTKKCPQPRRPLIKVANEDP